MKRVLVIVAVLVASVACGSNGHKADQGACKAALVQELKANMATGDKGTEPSSCKGLSQSTLSTLAGQAMAEVLKEVTDQ